MTSLFFCRSLCNKTIIRFDFCDIQNTQGLCKDYTPTLTLIILDITKTSSNIFVYVIGLHAVQFGNNWTKKIWLSEEFFESNYFQIGQACSPLTY